MCKIHGRTSIHINSFLKHRILYKTNIYNNLKLKKMKKCLLVIVITGIMTFLSLGKFYSSKTAAIKPNITCKKIPGMFIHSGDLPYLLSSAIFTSSYKTYADESSIRVSAIRPVPASSANPPPAPNHIHCDFLSAPVWQCGKSFHNLK